MSESSSNVGRAQALRLKRFQIASGTYALGLAILGLCCALGLLELASVGWIGLAFALVNAGFYAALRSGWNLRFAEPSLTLPQICVAVTMVALVVALGEQVHFLAVPFYSSLFVFAMLQLRPRQLVAVEALVLATYGAAVWIRSARFGGRLDLRVEALYAVLVVLSSVWYAVAASYIGKLRARLRESVQRIERLASRDALTDVWNRRHIDLLLAAELARRQRAGLPLCVGLVDLDHFKSVNDRFGHLVGDEVLRAVAATMQAQLRGSDLLGRFGGEEFLLVLPGVALVDARACAERLLQRVAALRVLPDDPGRVTISIGLAECGEGESVHALLSRADAALYHAKRAGRNRIEWAASAVAVTPRAPRQPSTETT